MIYISVNGVTQKLDVDPETTLLRVLVLRDLPLNDTTYACGIATCGACAVNVYGNAVCSLPILPKTLRTF